MTNVEIIPRGFDIVISDETKKFVILINDQFYDTEFFRFIRFIGYSDWKNSDFSVTTTIAQPYLYNRTPYEKIKIKFDGDLFTFYLPDGEVVLNGPLFLEELDDANFETDRFYSREIEWNEKIKLHLDEYDLYYVLTDVTGQYRFEVNGDNNVDYKESFTLLSGDIFKDHVTELNKKLTAYLKKKGEM